MRVERIEARRDAPGRLVADLMTGHARLDVRHHLLGVERARGYRRQSQPLVRRIDLRRRPRVGCRHGREIQLLPRPRLRAWRVDEAVPPHEDVEARVRHVGEKVAPLLVGHHDADEVRGKGVGLGDHPDPRLGTVGPADHAADVIRVQYDGIATGRLGVHARQRSSEHPER